MRYDDNVGSRLPPRREQKELAYWGRDNMAAISQTIFSGEFRDWKL